MGNVRFLNNDDDPFKTSKSGQYDKEKVYVNATDGRGHSDDVRVKIPQGGSAQIAELVRQCPEFRSNSDFVRDAIVHHLQKWGETSKNRETTDYVDLLSRLEDMSRLEESVKENESYLAKTKEIFNSAVSRKDHRTLARAIEQAEGTLDVLEQPWRGDMEASIVWAKSQLGMIGG